MDSYAHCKSESSPRKVGGEKSVSILQPDGGLVNMEPSIMGVQFPPDPPQTLSESFFPPDDRLTRIPWVQIPPGPPYLTLVVPEFSPFLARMIRV